MRDQQKKSFPHRYGGEIVGIPLQLPKEMPAVIDRKAKKPGITRNEILALSMEFALMSLEIADK